MKAHPVVFFGTHTFACTILQGLIESPFIDVQLVITQPDKPAGRKRELSAPPVKQFAQQHVIPVEQPESLKSYMLDKAYTIGVVAQYGLLIPKKLLALPTHGILNVHTSLLPTYRGASPIQSALINGEVTTGVTIMKMDAGMDTGPILLQRDLPIDAHDTYLTLDQKLAALGKQALLDAIPPYLTGDLTPTPQNDAAATTCFQLTRETGKIDWRQSTQQIYNQYRGLTPWPGIWTQWKGKRLKLLAIQPGSLHLSPGTVSTSHDTLHIGTGDGSISVTNIQLEGKRAMDISTFVNGHGEIEGATLL